MCTTPPYSPSSLGRLSTAASARHRRPAPGFRQGNAAVPKRGLDIGHLQNVFERSRDWAVRQAHRPLLQADRHRVCDAVNLNASVFESRLSSAAHKVGVADRAARPAAEDADPASASATLGEEAGEDLHRPDRTEAAWDRRLTGTDGERPTCRSRRLITDLRLRPVRTPSCFRMTPARPGACRPPTGGSCRSKRRRHEY